MKKRIQKKRYLNLFLKSNELRYLLSMQSGNISSLIIHFLHKRCVVVIRIIKRKMSNYHFNVLHEKLENLENE